MEESIAATRRLDAYARVKNVGPIHWLNAVRYFTDALGLSVSGVREDETLGDVCSLSVGSGSVVYVRAHRGVTLTGRKGPYTTLLCVRQGRVSMNRPKRGVVGPSEFVWLISGEPVSISLEGSCEVVLIQFFHLAYHDASYLFHNRAFRENLCALVDSYLEQSIFYRSHQQAIHATTSLIENISACVTSGQCVCEPAQTAIDPKMIRVMEELRSESEAPFDLVRLAELACCS